MQIEDHTKEAEILHQMKSVVISRGEGQRSGEETLIHEHFMEVRVNGCVLARLSVTADHLKELVIGRLRTEGLITGTDDVEKLFICGQGNLAEVTLKEDISLEPYRGVEPSCCAGNIQLLSPAGAVEISELPKVKPDESVVFSLAESFVRDSALHLKTGGTHSCYLYLPDGGIACYEDISRHNALDKAVGRILLDGADPLKCVLYTTGRVPADMARKALMAGVPVLVSKSVPTDAAVELAKKNNLNLICRAWPDSFTVY